MILPLFFLLFFLKSAYFGHFWIFPNLYRPIAFTVSLQAVEFSHFLPSWMHAKTNSLTGLKYLVSLLSHSDVLGSRRVLSSSALIYNSSENI